MTDAAPVAPPRTRLQRAAEFLGDTARPAVMLAVGIAEAVAIGARADPGVIAAGGFVLGALFGVKGAEAMVDKVQTAKVQAAAVAASPTDANTIAMTAGSSSSPAAANALNVATATTAAQAASTGAPA